MKLLQKTVAALAVSALLLTGCVSGAPTTDPEQAGTPPVVPATDPTAPVADSTDQPPTATRLSEIESAWLVSTGAPLGSWCQEGEESYTDGVRYYGSFAGYDILFRPTGTEAETQLEVEELVFEHNDGFEIFAYRDGEFTELAALYAKGGLTRGQLGQISALHLAYEDRVSSIRIPEISADIQTAMMQAFLAKFDPNGNYSLSHMSVTYFGGYGNTHVGFINCDGIVYTQALTSETIDGVTFQYHSGQKLQAYYEGELMTLREAFDRGVLTREDLIAIRNQLNPQKDEAPMK